MSTHNKVRLILHVGAGKTGTTSIQETLRLGQEKLLSRKIWYLGLMLENANILYSWQRPTTVNQDFHALPGEARVAQIVTVMRQVIDRAKAKDIDTLVWSNESFFDTNADVLAALSSLRADLDITVIAYVRRHDKWASSAYVQWGMRHKTYSGAIRPFREWMKTGVPKFSERLKVFIDADIDRFLIRNLDSVKDSVADFLELLQIGTLGLVAQRSNESSNSVELFLRALFNNQLRQPALPALFDRVVGRGLYTSKSPQHFLENLLPNAADLEAARKQCQEDKDRVDSILANAGQPPLSADEIELGEQSFSQEQLAFSLSKIVLAQAIRLERLEHTLKKLQESHPSEDNSG